MKQSRIKLFADDSNVFIIDNNLVNLYKNADNEFSLLSKWISSNKLHINYLKTTYMIFKPSKYSLLCDGANQGFTLKINGQNIEQVFVVKYLGVFIDDKLDWSDHINSIIKKISSLSGILSRTDALLPIKCKKNIYFALIHSILIYCIEAYGNVSNSKLNPLSVKCNRLLRLLQCKPRCTPLRDLYSNFNILPINLLFNFHTLKFIHKCFYNNSFLPVIVRTWFIRGNTLHSHNTRHCNSFIINSNCNPKSLLFYGPSLWANIPNYLQNDPSHSSFIRNLSIYLLNSN